DKVPILQVSDLGLFHTHSLMNGLTPFPDAMFYAKFPLPLQDSDKVSPKDPFFSPEYLLVIVLKNPKNIPSFQNGQFLSMRLCRLIPPEDFLLPQKRKKIRILHMAHLAPYSNNNKVRPLISHLAIITNS